MKIPLCYNTLPERRKPNARSDSTYCFTGDSFGLFEEIVNSKDVYINDPIRYRIDHLIKDTQGALRVEGNGKDIFKLLSLFLLDIPDERICDVSRDRASIIVLLETVFLQYFSVGQEEKQELRMTYNELFKIIGIQINEEIRV